MVNYKDNFPLAINQQFRQYIVDNARTAQKDKEFVLKLIEDHKENDERVHKSEQIMHENSTVDNELKNLRNQVRNQVIGSNGDSVSEVKDIRVDIDGNLHELAQDRLNVDFQKIKDVADSAKGLADKHEEALEKTAFYNEITTTKGRKYGTTYYLTYIPHIDSEGNLIKLKKGVYGNDPNSPEGLTPSEFSKKNVATFVSNASTFSANPIRLHGEQLLNGQILKSVKGDEYAEVDKRWTLAIGDDNTLEAFQPNITAEQIRNKGYNNTVSAFGPLIIDGKNVLGDEGYSSNDTQNHPRQVIAQLPNKDIIFFSCDGRETNHAWSTEKGMTLKEVVNTLFDHYDIKFAYNLDGGGSTSSVVRSHKINKSLDDNKTSERKVADFLYINKEVVQQRDKDIQNAYSDIGEVRDMLQKVYGELYYFNKTRSQEFGVTGYNNYSGFIVYDDDDNAKKKFYMTPNDFKFYDYNSASTWFRVTKDYVQFMGKALATNYSAPPQVTDLNSIDLGGTYFALKEAKGAPYPGLSSAMVTQYNINVSLKDSDVMAFQVATPFARTQNLKMKRRSFTEGKWSQWYEV